MLQNLMKSIISENALCVVVKRFRKFVSLKFFNSYNRFFYLLFCFTNNFICINVLHYTKPWIVPHLMS